MLKQFKGQIWTISSTTIIFFATKHYEQMFASYNVLEFSVGYQKGIFLKKN
jgi:hypothetical protein